MRLISGESDRLVSHNVHRYRFLDVLYTAFHQASTDGTPVLNPMWHFHPKDPNTFAIDLQFFFGASILASPVTD
jgi:alpha-glucosidase